MDQREKAILGMRGYFDLIAEAEDVRDRGLDSSSPGAEEWWDEPEICHDQLLDELEDYVRDNSDPLAGTAELREARQMQRDRSLARQDLERERKAAERSMGLR